MKGSGLIFSFNFVLNVSEKFLSFKWKFYEYTDFVYRIYGISENLKMLRCTFDAQI